MPSGAETAKEILGYLAVHPDSTRDQIVGGTSANRASVFRYLEEHRDRGIRLRLIVDGSGSRPERFRLKRGIAPLLLAIDIGAGHWRVTDTREAEVDAGEAKVEAPQGDWPAIDDPFGALSTIAAAIKNAYPVEEIEGILVGVPLPVNDDQRIVARGDSDWSGLTIRFELEKELGREIDIRITSDVELGALAELQAARLRSGPGGAASSDHDEPLTLLYVKWSRNLRAATVIGGHPHNGDGLADAFLHDPLDPGLARAYPADGDCGVCGRRCVAGFAQLKTVFEDVEEIEQERIEGANTEARADELLRRIEADPDGEVARRLSEAGKALGRVLGRAANTIVPDHVILGGAVKRGAPWDIRKPVREGFDHVIAPGVAARMLNRSIENGTYTGQAARRGAEIALGKEFAAAALWQTYLRREKAEAA